MKEREVTIYTDGACKGNPGKGFSLALFEIKNPDGTESGFCTESKCELTTNNRAEYTALILALDELEKETLFLEENKIDIKLIVSIYTDSKLIVGHLNDGWKINKNHDLVNKSKQLLDRIRKNHPITIGWIPRDKNKAGIKLEEYE